MEINKDVLFAYLRKAPFGGRLTQEQVDGLNVIIKEWSLYVSCKLAKPDYRHLAYVLATVFHETGGKMACVREGFASSDARARKVVSGRTYGKPDPKTGHVYYGRGYVQLTWAGNYDKMGKVIERDLLNNPDAALIPHVAAEILMEGMFKGKTGAGDFTGKSLEDYFNESVEDPIGARKIINGLDKAKLIAGYYKNFLDALRAAEVSFAHPPVAQAEAKVDGPSLITDKTTLSAVASVISAGGAGMLTAVNNPWAFAAVAVVGFGVILFLSGRLEIKRKAGA
jgi:putative chitinase